jgi:hypothetical protein
MALLSCPHCGQPGISRARKFALGPAIPATCRSCDRQIGVPWSSMLAGLPFIAGLVVFIRNPEPALGLLALLIGALAMLFIHWRYVPLVRR